jgi:hypothetical protein
VALLVGASLPGAGARADIVVLKNGGFLKVTAYEAGEDTVRIELPMGGSMVLRLNAIERIIGDEIAPGAGPLTAFDLTDVSLEFREDEPMPENSYAAMFVEVGRRYSLSSRFLASIAETESGFEPWARSNKGAIGLMQVMPATAERFGVDPGQLYDPLICLDVGAQYLSHLRQRYKGDIALMLAAYNAGESTVERFGGVPPYLETQTYIRRVHRSYQESAG